MTTIRSFTSLGICAAVLVGGAVFVRSVPAAPARAVAKASVATGKSSYGQILFDGRGFALYAFTHDTRNKATSYGECAKKWPPIVVSSRPAAGQGTARKRCCSARRAAPPESSRRPTEVDLSTTTTATRRLASSSARTSRSSVAPGSCSAAAEGSSPSPRRVPERSRESRSRGRCASRRTHTARSCVASRRGRHSGPRRPCRRRTP